MKSSIRVGLVPTYLALCLTLGGASAAGFWANMMLQLIGLSILVWSLVVKSSAPTPAAGRQLLLISALGVAVAIIQLIPLPPSIWSSLPGRERVAEGFSLLGLPLPWLSVSLAPYRTLASVLWLLPAFAVIVGILKLGGFRAKWLAWTIVAVTAANVLLGTLQLLDGERSSWKIYRISTAGAATGFFANSNHLATLLLVTIPFLAALYLEATRKGRSAQRASALLVIVVGALAVVLVGLAINGSLAGIGLAVPVIAASLYMVVSRKRRARWWAPAAVLLLTTAGLYVLLTGPFGNNLVGSGASAEGSRSQSFRLSSQAARDFMPLGSGLGTFQRIYPQYEDPDSVTRFYVNHVHNDYIELALETGIPGLVVLGIFLLWWGRRTFASWAGDDPDHFARAATIASAAMLVHSVVDYPLRTSALSALLACCCALIAEPRSRAESARVRKSRQSEVSAQEARHFSADE